VAAERESAEDPGYSMTAGNVSLVGYREIGATTATATLAYGRVEADRRLFIYPRRRQDDTFRLSLSATFRQFSFRGFAPLVRVTGELNRSSIELFDYRRLRTEFGLARAF
ncbi:MAG: surface lipoprotein assembly modifier, partial [Allosphingosinicella sp.]